MSNAETQNDREQRNAVFGDTPTPPPPGPRSQLQIDIPTETVPLPSLGKVYPVGSPLAGQETIDIKAMTTKEEDILTSRALIKKGVVVTALLQSCVVDKRINVLDMLSGDRNALMVAVRITGYGEDYRAEIECSNPECEIKKEREFNLASLIVKRLEIDPLQPNTNAFQFKLPRCGFLVNFKFLTGREEEEIVTTQERLKKQGLAGNDSVVTTRLLYAIQSVNGVSDRNEISKFIKSLGAFDSNSLRRYIDKHEPGIEMKQTTACEACGHEEEVQIPFGVNFFWPQGN